MPKTNTKAMPVLKVILAGHQKITLLTKKVGNKEIVWGSVVQDRRSVLRRILKEAGWFRRQD